MVVGKYLVPDAWGTGGISEVGKVLFAKDCMYKKFLVVDVADLSCCYMGFKELCAVGDMINMSAFVPGVSYLYDGWLVTNFEYWGNHQCTFSLGIELFQRASSIISGLSELRSSFPLRCYFSLGNGIVAFHYRFVERNVGMAIYCKNDKAVGALMSDGTFYQLDEVLGRDISGILARRRMMGAAV